MLRVNQSSLKYKKQKGQISVFVGLTFLILFTLFAMTINVAMVVHDKINIQNAVDFASIYVAQKQAEQLNAIAHMNYQIRQAHKLLTFRYIVLGTVGIEGIPASSSSETLKDTADKVRFPACYSSTEIFASVINDNFCRRDRFTQRFNGIPILTVVNPIMGGNYTLRQTTIEIGYKIHADALKASLFDWWMTSNALASYRIQVGYRKSAIKALAKNLEKPIVAGGMKDLYGKDVFEGARKTFEYNLSESNKTAAPVNFQVFNSMQGLDTNKWLSEIKTVIVMLYADRELVGGGGVGGAFTPIIATPNYQYPVSRNASPTAVNEFLNMVDPDKFLDQFTTGGYGVPPNSDFEEILGFEKNPWYMVYNRVYATTVSQPLFNPGPGIHMSAQAFAKPFGGRVGPWFQKNWAPGSDVSSGPPTVPLWKYRKTGATPSGGDIFQFGPNAPKYPGDNLGWTSQMAVSSTGQIGKPSPVTPHQNDYTHLVNELFNANGTGNALARGQLRDREMAAVAPDLFDIYYYSIDPNFNENYLEGKLDNWLMNEMTFTHMPKSQPRLWRDLGYIGQGGERNFTVHNQLTMSVRRNVASQLFFALDHQDSTGRANLLTSWVGGINVMDYRSPASGDVATRFGKCQRFKTPSDPQNVPGECLAGGGRTGYSVKMVSKDYLTSPNLSMGNNVGAILNPPPSN